MLAGETAEPNEAPASAVTMVPGAWSYQLPAEPARPYPIPVWYRIPFAVEVVPPSLTLIVDGFAGSGWTLYVNGRRLARNFFNRGESVPTDVFLNPRIGVSHPIGTSAAMYFSYARNQQLAPFTQLYEWYDGNHSNNVFFQYQDPNQDPITSNNYELGFQWEFADGWGADVNAYMRAIENYGQILFEAAGRWKAEG